MHEFSELQNPSSCHWPMSFKKSRRFVGKPCSPVFGAPGCHPSTLIVIVHTVLASKCSVRTICLISEGYRTHRAVRSDEFQKITTFCRKTVLPGFWGTWLYQSTLFDLANTLLASKCSVKTICRISEGYRTHRGVTGPMNFKNQDIFFSEEHDPGILGHLAAFQAFNWPCTHCYG